MKSFLILPFLLYFFSVQKSFSQNVSPQNPYERMIIEGIEPIWYTTMRDSTFNDLGSDGYNCMLELALVEPLIYNQYYYTVRYLGFAKDGSYANFILYCFNLDDGTLVWQKKIEYSENPNIEFPRIMKIDDEGNLVLMGKKSSIPYNKGDQFFFDCILYERKHNALTGEFVSLKHRPIQDSTTVKMYHLDYEDQLFFEEGDNIRSMEWRVFDGKQAIVSLLMDKEGVLAEEPDTMIYQYTNTLVNGYNMVRISQDSVMLVEVGVTDSLETMIILRFFDNNLNFNYERRIFVDIPVNLPLLRLVGISPDRKKVMVSVYQSFTQDYPNGYLIAMVLHTDGYIVKKAKIDINLTLFFEWWDEKEGITYASFKEYQPGTHSGIGQIIHGYGDFQTEILSEHKFLNKLAYGRPNQFFEYKGKDIVFFYEQAFVFYPNANRYGPDIFAGASSIAAFEKGTFLPKSVYSSTEDESIYVEKTNVRIYPNPSSGLITIDLESDTPAGYKLNLSDLTGQKVFESVLTETDNTLDLSFLKSGMYIFGLCSDNKHCFYHKWVKTD
jgi:hypothetical protein